MQVDHHPALPVISTYNSASILAHGGRQPVDPSWCLCDNAYASPDRVSQTHFRSTGAPSPATQILLAATPDSVRLHDQSRKDSRDNDPPPFNLNEESFTVLRDRLWIPDTPIPPLTRCGFTNCNEMVPTSARIAEHYAEVHGFNRKSTQRCHWANTDGEECTSTLLINGVRRHMLGSHVGVLRGHCRVCNTSQADVGGMKRHLKSCLRYRSIESMSEDFNVDIKSCLRHDR